MINDSETNRSTNNINSPISTPSKLSTRISSHIKKLQSVNFVHVFHQSAAIPLHTVPPSAGCDQSLLQKMHKLWTPNEVSKKINILTMSLNFPLAHLVPELRKLSAAVGDKIELRSRASCSILGSLFHISSKVLTTSLSDTSLKFVDEVYAEVCHSEIIDEARSVNTRRKSLKDMALNAPFGFDSKEFFAEIHPVQRILQEEVREDNNGKDSLR